MGNYIRFLLNPQVIVALGARGKRPGPGITGQEVELAVVEHPAQGSGGRLEAYERLLSDAMAGDATLFAREDVVEAAWAVVEPVLRLPGAPLAYEPGTWGPAPADALVAEVGGWNFKGPAPRRAAKPGSA